MSLLPPPLNPDGSPDYRSLLFTNLSPPEQERVRSEWRQWHGLDLFDRFKASLGDLSWALLSQGDLMKLGSYLPDFEPEEAFKMLCAFMADYCSNNSRYGEQLLIPVEMGFRALANANYGPPSAFKNVIWSWMTTNLHYRRLENRTGSLADYFALAFLDQECKALAARADA